MKLIAAIPASFALAILAFALFFSVVEHPLLRIAGILIACFVAVLPFSGVGRWIARRVDDACNRRPRRRSGVRLLAVLLLAASACRPSAPSRAPEPVAALAEVETLDCGARACAVTEVAGATMITILE